MTSLRPATALKAEQIEKTVLIYKQCRTGLENLWSMASDPKGVQFCVMGTFLSQVVRRVGVSFLF